MTDNVNHPPHYKMANGAEVIDIRENLLSNRADVVKYVCRAGKKEGADELEDLRKAQWYMNREVERVARLRGETVVTDTEHDCGAEGNALDMRGVDHLMFTGETYHCYECGTPVKAVLMEVER